MPAIMNHNICIRYICFILIVIVYFILFIPEQFTVKAHPASFERGGVSQKWAKNEALLFQSTVDIHFQNAHKTLFQSTVDIKLSKRAQKYTKNCEG